MTQLSALDAVIGVVALAVAIMYLAVLPSETRQVRDGHPPTRWFGAVVMRRTKDEQRTPEEFAAKYRTQLKRNAWTGLTFGIVILVLATALVPFGATWNWWSVFLGLMLLCQSAGCFRALRILDAPRTVN